MAYTKLAPLGTDKPAAFGAGSAKVTHLDVNTRSVYDSLAEDLTVSIYDASGVVGAYIVLAIEDGEWSGCSFRVNPTADSGVATRLNRLLDGFAMKGLPTSAPPVLRKYWRTKSMALGFKRKQVSLPANVTLRVNKKGTAAYWSSTKAPMAVTPAISVLTSPSSTASAPKPEPKSAPKSVKPTAPVASTTALPAGHPGIFRMLPTAGGINVWQSKANKSALDAALKGHVSGDRTFITITGPSGSGKTVGAMDLARRFALPFWKVDVAGLRDFGDWAGYNQPTAKDGVMEMDYVPSQFVEAVSADGPYGGITRMVMLDEITRVETPGALNALLPCLDGTGTLYVADARRSIPIDPAVIFVATANIGAAFSGTVTLDVAFVNRGTHTVDVEFPPKASEVKVVMDQTGMDKETCRRLVDVASQSRSMTANGEIPVGVSTRQLVATAKSIVHGLLPLEAAKVGFVNTYSADGGSTSHRSKVLHAASGQLNGYVVPSQREEPEAPEGVTPSITTTDKSTTVSL